MKILVLSDNHHDWKIVEKILKNEDFDFSIHLGDACVTEKNLRLNFDKYVSGNHDDFSISEDTFVLEGLKFSILHGHTQGISLFSSTKGALKFAKKTNANIILHGHTHIPKDEYKDEIRIICPGSVSQPRSEHGKTYLIIEVENKKIINLDWKKLD